MKFEIFRGLIRALFILSIGVGHASSIESNSFTFSNPPPWLTESRVDRVTRSIQRTMEWDIRKAKVTWFRSQDEFQKFHGYDASVLAITNKVENAIYLGPRVTAENFDAIFGHELVHVILYQKYRTAIPSWLEEGLANFIAKKGKVDYRWLASQPHREIQTLVHPFLDSQKDSNRSIGSSTYHYQASTAMIEMIASRCSLNDLLQLSVGKKLENYLSTFCQIQNINEDFRKWIKKKI